MRLNRLLPWFKEEEELKKDIRTDEAVKHAKKVEDRIRRLAEGYQAQALLVQKTRQKHV